MGRGIRCRTYFNYNLSFDPVGQHGDWISRVAEVSSWLAACLHNSVTFCSELKVDLDKQGRKHAASKQTFPNFLNGWLLGGNIALKCG